MAETPEYCIEDNFTNDKTFNLKYEEINYILELTSNSLEIQFSIYKQNESTDKFENKYSLNNLIKINKSFSYFNSIEEARKQIEELIALNKYKVILKDNSELLFILTINIFAQIIDINFILKGRKINQKEINKNLNKQIQNLNEEIKKLKNDNNELKNKILELQNENKEIKKNFIELKEEFLKIKEINSQNKELDYSSELFKFRFKEGKNYSISQNGKIATRNNSSGFDFDCTIIGNLELLKNKITKWKLKINSEINKSFIIGVGPDNPKNESHFYKNCWCFDCNNNRLILHSMKYTDYENNKLFNAKIVKGDIITVEINRIQNNLSFSVNNNFYGIACSNIPSDETLYPIVILYSPLSSIEIID